MMTDSLPETGHLPDRHNSFPLGCLLLVAIWIAGLAFVIYPLVWLIEQIALTSGFVFNRSLWVGAVASHGLAVLLACVVGLAIIKISNYRAILRTWALAGLFVLLVLPVQIIQPPAAQLAALLQIIGAALYLVVLTWLRRRKEAPLTRPGYALWPTIAAVGLIIWPWFIWGALGSWLDTLLNLMSAVLFGLAACRTLQFLSDRSNADGSDTPPLSRGLAGLAISIAWLTMGAAFGYNGQQLLFLGLLSPIGWLATFLSGWGINDSKHISWRAEALLAGALVAAPMLFVDPDELLLVLNFGSQDILYYALKSMVFGIAIAGILTILARLFYRAPIKGSWKTTTGVFLVVLLALSILYFTLGQPGWHGDQLYVILKDQADLSEAGKISDPIERRTFVYDTLVHHAENSQNEISQVLDRIRIQYSSFYLVNALEVDGGPLIELWLKNRPEVDRVLISPSLRPLTAMPVVPTGTASRPDEPEWNLVQIGAPRTWEEYGIRGAGIVIGQSDSGVDAAHPELQAQYRGNESGALSGDSYNWYDPWYGSGHPIDYGGHGTHTLGSVLGRTVGVAPDASWIGCVNLARNMGNPSRYLDCLQFMLAPFPIDGDPLHDGKPEFGADVLNNSWGCPEIEGCDADALLPAVHALRAAGVFVVASAGNDGNACSTIDSPISLYDDVFTVGANDEGESIAFFSSRGPVTADGSNRTKPDIVAPGVDVLSSMPNGTYEFNSGTSMAGPHIAGVVALLWSADPSLIGDIDRTEELLIKSARPVTEPSDRIQCGITDGPPDNIVGYGLVDAYAAVSLLLNGSAK